MKNIFSISITKLWTSHQNLVQLSAALLALALGIPPLLAADSPTKADKAEESNAVVPFVYDGNPERRK